MVGDVSTPAGDDDPDDGDTEPDGTEASEASLYRWTCPYCGTSGIQSATPGDVDRYVVNALRSHVLSTDGDGHGPKHTLPDGGSTVHLDDCVDVPGVDDGDRSGRT